ncbi:MAG: FG-GAP repeat domain-containing protein [Planctomycetota bacterium]
MPVGRGSALVALTLPAAGQQFVEETAARFPSPNPTEYTNQLTIGDLDNDGDLDIIFANGGDFNEAGIPQRQRVYINDGSGTFTDETIRLNFAGLCRGVELGDIDNDGDLDLYLTSGTSSRFTCGQYRVYVNDGNGFFSDETASRHPIGNVCNNMDCIVGDIDGDCEVGVTDFLILLASWT